MDLPAATDRYFSKAEMLRILDVSASVFDRDYAPLVEVPWKFRMGGEHGHPMHYHARHLIDAWAKRREALNLKNAARDVAGGDESLQGASSGGLERYRLAKAGLAENELARDNRQIVNRDEVIATWEAVASIFRSAYDRMLRIDEEAAGVFVEAIDAAERLWEPEEQDERRESRSGSDRAGEEGASAGSVRGSER